MIGTLHNRLMLQTLCHNLWKYTIDIILIFFLRLVLHSLLMWALLLWVARLSKNVSDVPRRVTVLEVQGCVTGQYARELTGGISLRD